MKRIFCICFLALLATVFTVPAFADTFSEDTALNLIFNHMKGETGHVREEFSLGQIVQEDDEWAFSLILIDHANDEDGLYVGQLSNNGQVTLLQYPSKISLNRQMEADLKSCFNTSDCYLRLIPVCEKWSSIVETLTPEETEQIFDKYLSVVNLNICLPESGAISFDDAHTYALDCLVKELGWSCNAAQMFRLCITAYYIPKDIGKPVYFFYLEKHSRFEDAYSSDSSMKKYNAQLATEFGDNVPASITILIDAADGSLVEKPVIDYPPTRFHYLDSLIRTDNFILAVKEQ